MNIGTLLTKAARTFPGNLAVVHGPRRLTYAQFNARVNRLANALARLGLGRGHHMALLQYNYAETLESMFACFKAGCGVVPINFRLHPNEYAFILDHSESKAVLLSEEFNDGVLAVRDRIPGARHLITLAGGTGALLDCEALLAAAPAAWQDVPVHPDSAWSPAMAQARVMTSGDSPASPPSWRLLRATRSRCSRTRRTSGGGATDAFASRRRSGPSGSKVRWADAWSRRSTTARRSKSARSPSVEVRFELTNVGTQVTLEHRGWAALPAKHPARHRLDGQAFTDMIGRWGASS